MHTSVSHQIRNNLAGNLSWFSVFLSLWIQMYICQLSKVSCGYNLYPHPLLVDLILHLIFILNSTKSVKCCFFILGCWVAVVMLTADRQAYQHLPKSSRPPLFHCQIRLCHQVHILPQWWTKTYGLKNWKQYCLAITAGNVSWIWSQQ